MDLHLSPYHRRTRLPHALALLYGLAIVYASLQPFGVWVEPPPGTPFFLFAPWPSRWLRYDFTLNVIAYIPFGFFVALLPQRATPAARVALPGVVGFVLSFGMESLQMFLPLRVASVIDLIANTTGALAGGALGATLARSEGVKRTITTTRVRLFLPGHLGDFGIALFVLWLAAQVNPGIPLFSVTFDPEPGRLLAAASTPPESAAIVIEAAESAFQMLGVGLFLALLLRERRYVGGAALLLVGAAALVKGIAAAVLLKPAAWENWLTPGVSLGVAAGSLLLSMAIWVPRPAQVTLAAVALLSSLLATVFAPDLVYASAPIRLFNGPYGHLLNFNGLTHTVLLLWPAVASVFLLALAGRPGWGEPA